MSERQPSRYSPAVTAATGEEGVVVPWAQLLRRRVARRVEASERYRWWILWSVLAGLLAVNITFTVFVVAFPRVAGDLGTTENTLTWTVTGPLLGFGVAAPVLGKVGDLWGYRRLYLAGLAGAIVISLLSAMAWDAGSLIAFRALGGLEGAATGAASMALIFAAFEQDDRVKAMGWWALVGAGGPVIGVVIGGPVIEHVGWRVLFVAQAPLALAALVLGAAVLPETARGVRERFDLAGAATLAAGVTAVLFALNRGPEWGWSSPAVVMAFVVAPVGLALFVAAERRSPAPLLPLGYLRRRNFVLPMTSQAFSQGAYMGGFILVPSLLVRVVGYDEDVVGPLTAVRPLTFSLVSPIGGYFAARVGERPAAAAGAAAVVASMLVFASVSGDGALVPVLAGLALSGFGLGLSSPALAASVANSVDEHDLGVASGAQQLVVQVGIVAGIQVMKTVQASVPGGPSAPGPFRAAYLVGGGVAVAGALLAGLVRSARRRTEPEPLPR